MSYITARLHTDAGPVSTDFDPLVKKKKNNMIDRLHTIGPTCVIDLQQDAPPPPAKKKDKYRPNEVAQINNQRRILSIL